MNQLADTARFRTIDPEELVLACLACPICLHCDEVEWELGADAYDPFARCVCHRCEESWRLYMTQYQALRLGLLAVRSH